MICSHERGFIFIKTRKTASTSIEIGLSELCGPDDIVTPVSPEDEIFRRRLGFEPRNYSGSPWREAVASKLCAVGNERLLRLARRRLFPAQRFYNHMSAALVAERLPAGVWERYPKFTIERHPYEKVVSMAHFWIGHDKKHANGRPEVVADAVIESAIYLNYPLYTIDGKLAVDHFIRYERLLDDLNAILGKLDIPGLPSLPSAKASFRSNRSAARDILSVTQKSKIRAAAALEFDLFGFEP